MKFGKIAGTMLAACALTTALGVTPANAASSPSISPAARKVYNTTNGSPSCPSGNACAVVWDWSQSNWKVFELYNCATYSVSNWLGGGVPNNNQTPYGSPANTLRLYGANGAEINTGYAARSQTYSVNWDAVYKIRNCTA